MPLRDLTIIANGFLKLLKNQGIDGWTKGARAAALPASVGNPTGLCHMPQYPASR